MSSAPKTQKRVPAKRAKMTETSATEPQKNLTMPSNVMVTPQPKGPSRKELFRSVVTVRVGPEDGTHEEFVVHTELLCHHSPYFKAAVTGSWVEAQTGIINLDSDSPAVFEVFQDWLYGNRLTLTETQAADTSFVMQLYVFGDKVHCALFSTAALTVLKAQTGRSGDLFNLLDVQYAFANTPEPSALRDMIVAFWVSQPYLIDLVDDLLEDEYPKAFVAAVIKGALAQVVRKGGGKYSKSEPVAMAAAAAPRPSGRNSMATMIAALSDQ